MLKLLRSLVTPKQLATTEAILTPPPTAISSQDSDDFDVMENLLDANGLPLLEWNAVQRWVEGITDEAAIVAVAQALVSE